MDIKILGSGCIKCQRLEKLTREAAAERGVQVDVEHVRDIARILEYQALGTPALVVNGELKTSGRIPSKEEIGGWLAPSQADG